MAQPWKFGSMPNDDDDDDKNSATRRAERYDCNSSAMAGFAAEYG